MAKTFLYDDHVKLGAKMVDFAGWDMPVQYTSIIEEHNNVRNNAGLFDVSHMGEIFVYGKEAVAYLQTLVPQDIEKIIDKKAKYCQFTNEQGGIIDDLFIYKLKENNYLLVVNASRLEADYKWMKEHCKDFDVVVDNLSADLSMVALQGPKAADILEKVGLSKEDHPRTMYIFRHRSTYAQIYHQAFAAHDSDHPRCHFYCFYHHVLYPRRSRPHHAGCESLPRGGSGHERKAWLQQAVL